MSGAGRRVALAAAWLLVFGVPLALLAGETTCAARRWLARRAAAEYRRQHPIFEPDDPRQQGRGLWRVPWQEYRPGAHLEYDLQGEHHVIQINQRGFRTREFEEAKAAGVVRVVCLGGSTTVFGRTNDETYPALLEAGLRRAFPGAALEVLNLGISGATSEHWLRRRGQLFRLQPDVVVQYEGVNDIFWKILPRYASAHPLRRALNRSLLFQRLFPLDAAQLDEGYQATLANLARMADLCRGSGARHVAGSFAAPDDQRLTPGFRASLDEVVRDWDRDGLHTACFRDYARFLARYDQLFEDAVRERSLVGVMVHRRVSDPGLFTDHCHLTQAGIARLAEAFLPEVAAAVEKRLRRRGLPPGAAGGRPGAGGVRTSG